jgi:hypothetical protein
MVAMQTVAIVTLTRLHLLGAALRATRTVGPTHLPPRFGATGSAQPAWSGKKDSLLNAMIERWTVQSAITMR